LNSLPLKQTKIIVGGVLVLLLAGFLFFYSDYQATREQAADITGTLAKIQQEYIRTFVAQGRFPRFNQEANLPKAADARFGAIQSAIVMKDQRLFLVIKDRSGATSTLYLTPEMNSEHRFSWFCRSPDLSDLLRDHLFPSCQASTETLSVAQATALQGKPRKRKPQPAESAALDFTLPPAPPQTAPPPTQPCEASPPRELLIYDNGIGIWDFSQDPVLDAFVPMNIQRPNGMAARIGKVLFVLKEGYIWYADTGKQPITLEKSSVWIKAGTHLYSTGQQLIWITPDHQLFVGDVCYPPNIRIIHNTKLRYSSRNNLVSVTLAEGDLHLLSRYGSDWSNRSNLDVYRIKKNGTLVHAFNFRFDGMANNMYRAEPFLLIANGRDGLSIKERTSDLRWMETDAVSALDFVMDAVIKDNTLWVADRSAGLLVYRRRSQQDPWEQIDQREFDFPAFKLRWFEHGVLVSSATNHAWVPHGKQGQRILQPASPVESH
tara:strand:- start:178 stop:1647 length:1470 start_codon:yes stop_codon:yes gene_type:complete